MQLIFLLICQLNPEKFRALLEKCNIGTPIFHAYAHEANCQHRYNPRALTGFGLADGENIERLWFLPG